jgi:16S rRNA (guanine966-N2)-methyltransferase
LIRIGRGMWKGHILRPPSSVAWGRPTASRVREAVFDMLGPGALEGEVVWDLCCGSGAFGIEALSAGASRCTFVDRDARATAFVREFLDGRQAFRRARVITGNVKTVVPALDEHPDLVYLDPPYRDDKLYSWAGRYDWGSVLAEGGSVFVETGSERDLPDWEERRYGDTHLYRWRAEISR